jgi:hypothetical protein
MEESGGVSELTISKMNDRTKFVRLEVMGEFGVVGQLSVVDPLPEGLPDDFVKKILEVQPWYSDKGINLGMYRRRIERYDIGEVAIVMKRSERTGQDLINYRRLNPHCFQSAVLTTSPSAQVAIVDEAKRRYSEVYHEELPVEQCLGFFINKTTKERFMFYRYYDELRPNAWSSKGADIWTKAIEVVRNIDDRLSQIRVDRGEQTNFLLVKDDKHEDGFRVMLIDTEFWRIVDSV